MKKQQLKIQNDPEILYKKNRSRLIQQNRQLYSQIFKLQHKVSTVLTKNIANQFNQVVQQQINDQKRKQQTKEQVLLINKLKKKILLLKNSQKHQQKDDLRQALDQLQFLKKQRQKLVYQKQALRKKRSLKNQSLQLNKPLQQDKQNLLASFKTAQRQNFQLKSKVVKLQRQIINFHKIKQLAKTSAPKAVQNQKLQIAKVQNQINKIKNQIKSFQKQWQPQVDSLNTQYFVLKQILDEKNQQIQKGQKTIKNYQNRILAMKQEQKIIQDKARIANVVISPDKRKQIQEIYQAQKQRQSFFQQFRRGSKSLIKSNTKKSNQKLYPASIAQSRLKSNLQPSSLSQKIPEIQREEKKLSPPKQNQKLVVEDLKNQFEQEVQSKSPKKNKILTSVAVGTTFYYEDDQQLA